MFSLRARVVYAVDRPPIEHGTVTIDGERIVAVGTKPAGELLDLGPVALLPGLVNAHTHLEFSHLRRPLGEPGMSLVDWIRLVIGDRSRGDRDVARSIHAGLAECLCFGVTSLGEIVSPEGAGYRGAPVDMTAFVEVIGFSRARAASAMTAACEKLKGLRAQADLHVGISPHAPYTVSPQLLDSLIGLARQLQLPVAMHLAESREEIEFLATGKGPFQQLLLERSMWDSEVPPRGSRPMDYLRMLAEAPRALVIHGNYLDEEERAFIAAKRGCISLVYCPRTHAYFRHSPYPLPQLLAAGARVVLGTDSRASNPDLNLLAEMRHVVRIFPKIDPHVILRMGTLASAEAIGRADEFGSITPGKFANLIAIPFPAEVCDRLVDPLAAIFDTDLRPCAIWYRGKKLPPLTG